MKTPTYTPDFKQGVVEQLLSGEATAAQLCRQHRMDDSTLRRWRREYAEHGQNAWTGNQEAVSQERRIAELERMIGQLTMENAILKKAAARSVPQNGAHSPLSS